MRGARAAFVAVAAGLGLLCAPGIAAADVIFDQADAQDLADTLADATKVQGVCYGWHVTVDDNYDYQGGDSVGSNLGPGKSLDDAGTQCNRRVEFRATITYTSSSSESEDSATWSVSSLPSGPSTSDLDDLGLFDEDDLIGDDPDIAIDKAVNALPQLTADSGAAKPIPATQETQVAPDAGNLTDNPGNDFLRAESGTLLFGAVLLIGGIVFAVYVLRQSKQQPRLRSMRAPAEPPVGTWQRELQQHQPPAYPPPNAGERQGGQAGTTGQPGQPTPPAQPTPPVPPGQSEPPTEPFRSQQTSGPAAQDGPERTEKIDPPARPADGAPEPTRRIDRPGSSSAAAPAAPPSDSDSVGSGGAAPNDATDDPGPERTEKLDPRNPPGDAGR